MRGYARLAGYYSTSTTELKFFDLDLDDAVVAIAGTVTDSINKIAQGTTEVQRNGRKCVVKSIEWRMRFFLPEFDAVATPAASDTIRVILYRDKQANGATAAVLDILETADFQSFYNLSNQNRFSVVCDKLVTLDYHSLASDGAGLVSGAEATHNLVYKKAINMPLEFSDTTGAITEIRSNNLGVLLLSKAGLAGFESKIRLRFLG